MLAPTTFAQATTPQIVRTEDPTPTPTPTPNPTPEPLVQKLSGVAGTITKTAGTSQSITVTIQAAAGQKVSLHRNGKTESTAHAPASDGAKGTVSIKLPRDWWRKATDSWRVQIEAGQNSAGAQIPEAYVDFKTYSKRVYNNPNKYFTVSETNSSFKNYKPRNLVTGTEGIRVYKIIKRYNVKGARGAHWGKVSGSFKSRIKGIQRKYNKSHKHNVRTDGIVDYKTWRAMGFSHGSWFLDRYASPTKVNRASSKHAHIEAMIKRAYQYKGRTYIVGASSITGFGLDCSGLVIQAMYAAGVKGMKNTPMWHSQPGGEWGSRWMFKTSKMKKISYKHRKRGDLVFYRGRSGAIIHVAIYLGNNKVIESWPNRVMVAKIKNSHRSNVAGIRRIFN